MPLILMMSHDDDSINFDKLEKELTSAVVADERYWTENDAKIRAVHQKVATYDEFRDIVLAAHLKPLDKGDKINTNFYQTWNSLGSKTSKGETTEAAPVISNSSKLPKNGQEFVREWRKCKDPGDQYDFLIRLGGEILETIFKSEISFGLLGDMIKSLSDIKDKDEETIVDILMKLSKTNRFSLNVQFLSNQEKEYCERLFHNLNTKASHFDLTFSEKSVRELAQIYGIKL